MHLYKKILIGLVIVVSVLLLADFGLNFWIDKKLPTIISEKNDSPYYITYKNLDVALWSGNIKATGILLLPKASMKDTINKAGIYSRITSIEIKKFRVWDVLFNDKIKAKSITINEPHFILYKKNEKAISNARSIRSEVVEPFTKIVIVSDIYLNKGDVKIIYIKSGKPILSAQNITIQLEGIVITDAILKNKIPFSYSKYAFSCDSIYYRANEFYHIKADRLQTENRGLSMKKIAVVPEYTRKQFVQKLKKEKDLYAIKTESLIIKNMDWGFKNETFFFNAKSLLLDNVSANIYRSKMPDDDLSRKPLYNKLLREMKFYLKVDTLSIRNSMLVYEEEINFEKGPGKLTFNKFNLTATNIISGLGQKKLPDLKIKIHSMFMNTSPLKVNWTLNVLDKSDGFNIRGSILNFNTQKIKPFSKPYINATTEGVFDEVYFNFTGNDIADKGEFALKYHDFKVALYKKKDPEKKAKLKTAIANLFVKNDSDNKTKNTNVELKRIQEKSFYNFLWRSIAEGLKKILI